VGVVREKKGGGLRYIEYNIVQDQKKV